MNKGTFQRLTLLAKRVLVILPPIYTARTNIFIRWTVSYATELKNRLVTEKFDKIAFLQISYTVCRPTIREPFVDQ